MLYQLLCLTIGLGIALFFAIKTLQKHKSSHEEDLQKFQELEERLKKTNLKYGEMISREDSIKELDSQITASLDRVQQVKSEEQELSSKILTLRRTLQKLEEQEIFEAFGFYDSKYNFQEVQRYKEQLDNIRSQQKEIIKSKKAAVCDTQWSVEGSIEKGKRMTNDFIKLVLRAFNGECDASVAKVKYSNVKVMENRIRKTYDDLNKLSETTRCKITSDFLDLKLQELWLTYEYQERKHQEQEEQRIIREQMREEEKALREIETARQDAEKEEHRYQKALEKARRDLKIVTEKAQEPLLNQIEELQRHLETEANKEDYYQEALEKARRDLETVTGQAQEILLNQIEELQKRLIEAEANKERAISQAQLTKFGHVYIISNIGSFGENIYKIGMTRRLEPMDRVKELGGASVPFPFDVHAMIFCENAPELESRLHRYLSDRRMNKENTRKEFFQVSLDEVVKTVREIDRELKICKSEIVVTKIAEASDYRKTLARERQSDTDLN
jgi:Domain of unknown function (DUF4041)/T5orf172 domain